MATTVVGSMASLGLGLVPLGAPAGLALLVSSYLGLVDTRLLNTRQPTPLQRSSQMNSSIGLEVTVGPARWPGTLL